MSDNRGAETPKMARWQGRMETEVASVRQNLEERDMRYSERAEAQNKAVEAALAAQKEAVSAALAASDKAVGKAEVTAEKWRDQANEWRGAMSDRDKELPSRREVETQFKGVNATLAAVKLDMVRLKGEKTGTREGGDDSDARASRVIALTAVGVSLFLGLSSLITAIVLAGGH